MQNSTDGNIPTSISVERQNNTVVVRIYYSSTHVMSNS